MKASDFEFNGKRLSEFGCIIANFDGGKGLETIDGVEITFNTIPSLNGSIYHLASSVYESCLETTIQIAKYSCSAGIQEITTTEHRNLTRWLSQKKFMKFKILDENHIDLYYNAAFSTISKIEIDGRLMGLELNIITNSPYALKEPKNITVKNSEANGKHSINDTSHEEGYIYPYTEIVVGNIDDIPEEKRNLRIHNAIENRDTYIANVSTGEVITMDYPVISSSDSSHNIQNDFNWAFFRVANTYENSRNDLTISLPCTIKIKYSPIVKVGL